LFIQKWEKFKGTTCDPWVLPTDEHGARGDMYTVYSGDAAAFMNDKEFMTSHRVGLRLLARSWGWDLDARKVSEHLQSHNFLV
jgi:hypothetical protein